MADIDYPLNLRGPLVGKSKNQTAVVRQTQPLSGPAYTQKLSTDAPVTYNLSFLFTSPSEALLFRAWVTSNQINRGKPFNCQITHEGSQSGGKTTQEVKFIADGPDLLSNTYIGTGKFRYEGTFQCRKEVTGLEDFYELIEEGGLYLLEGREILDESINIDSPEV